MDYHAEVRHPREDHKDNTAVLCRFPMCCREPRREGERGEWFNIKTGVKQGCNMSGFLFLIVMDWIMRRTVGKGKNGIRWRLTTKLDDLDFADDVALLSSSRNQMQEKTSRMDREAKRVGLKINLDKTKVIRINAKNQVPISIVGKNIKEVEEFTYLGAKVNKEGGGMEDLQSDFQRQD